MRNRGHLWCKALNNGAAPGIPYGPLEASYNGHNALANCGTGDEMTEESRGRLPASIAAHRDTAPRCPEWRTTEGIQGPSLSLRGLRAWVSYPLYRDGRCEGCTETQARTSRKFTIIPKINTLATCCQTSSDALRSRRFRHLPLILQMRGLTHPRPV